MTKEEYLSRLEQELAKLPKAERDEALEFYRDYLEDAENPDITMAKLGTPKELARSILADRAVKSLDDRQEGTGVRKGLSVFWIVALATLSPFALMLALMFIMLILMLIITVTAFTASMFVGGGWLLINSFAVMAIDAITAVFFIGLSLVLLGIAVIMTSIIWRVGGGILRWAALKINKRRSRRARA